MKNIPELTFETIKRMEDMTWFTYAQIFDDLLIVAQKETACFVWKTEAGIVIFDGIWPDEAVYHTILETIESVNWNPKDINKFIMTHGHVDHTGCGKWFVENHHAKTYLSEVDDVFWREHPTKPDRPETWKNFDVDCYVSEGKEIDCGDKSVTVVSTPGHTPGCMSYIFPVYENGVRHVAALFGGATPPRNDNRGREIHKESIQHFIATAYQTRHVIKIALSLCAAWG